MSVSYKKLWEVVKLKQLSRADLRRKIHVSEPTMSKLTKNEPVSMTVIIKLCGALHCDVGDVMEIVNE